MSDDLEPLRRLLEREGSAAAASRALGGSGKGGGYLNTVLNGKANFTDDMRARVDVALKTKPGERGGTPFVRRKPGKRAVYGAEGYPALIQELIAANGGTVKKAANALGFKSPYWIMSFHKDMPADRWNQFTDEDAARVKRALRGEVMTPPDTVPEISEVETGKLGLAIVFCPAAVFGALYDAAEAMGGRWVFKKSVGKQWMGICHIKSPRELMAFKAVASVIASSVITP